MLIHANRNIGKINQSELIYLTCASAMEMPYPRESFDQIFCGLATHHMNVNLLLKESYRILQFGGQLSFADVSSTKLWQIPGVKWVIRFLAFCYYVFKEGTSRARAEASAVSNVRTAEEWHSLLENYHFRNISIRELKSRFFWIPSPLVILAEKLEEEFNDKAK
jgi:ubiquinone/menaquinone biosynthesis C-methylase UbiE